MLNKEFTGFVYLLDEKFVFSVIKAYFNSKNRACEIIAAIEDLATISS